MQINREKQQNGKDQIGTQKRKMSPNTAIKIVIKSREGRTKEERKETGPQKSKTIKNIAVKHTYQ